MENSQPENAQTGSVVIRDLIVKAKYLLAKTKDIKVFEARARVRCPRGLGLVLKDTSKYVQVAHSDDMYTQSYNLHEHYSTSVNINN